MIDSERVTFEGYQYVLKDYNLTMSEEFYKTLLGKTLNSVRVLFKNEYGDIDLDDLVSKVHLYMANRFREEGVPVKKGLIELLTYLKANNYKTIVATSSHRDRVDEILKLANITQYFDDSICGDEVKNGKPNPEVFLTACKKLGVNTDEAIVLEDSEAGIMAASSANIKVICVPDMKYPNEEYANKTYKIIDSLDKVIEILK